jgi:esterase/lipase superfamily enzyme
MRTHNAFERAIVQDVFDFARRECSAPRVMVSGASLGAYHAANIAFRHPDAVSNLISLSGAFDISSFFDGFLRRQHLFQQPLRLPAEHKRSVEIQPHGHHHRHRRMGQHAPRIVSPVGNPELEGNPALAR